MIRDKDRQIYLLLQTTEADIIGWLVFILISIRYDRLRRNTRCVNFWYEVSTVTMVSSIFMVNILNDNINPYQLDIEKIYERYVLYFQGIRLILS